MSPSELVKLPLGQLEHHPSNVRKLPAGDMEQENTELITSIKHFGLLVPPIVVPNKVTHENGEPPAPFLVVAGGRRLDAMRNIVDDGHDGWSMEREIDCICYQDLDPRDVTAISLAENDARSGISTADEIEAFAMMHAEGHDAGSIGQMFGYAERTVKQRLSLATVHSELRGFFREDKMTLGALRQFAVVEGEEEQVEVWNALMEVRADESVPEYQRHRGKVRENEVWQHLNRRRTAASSRLAKFVGLDAYKEAGGRLETDLFEDQRSDLHVLDIELLEKLATEKLAAETEKLKEDGGWNWFQPMEEFDYSQEKEFVKARKSQAEPTEEEEAELKDLRTEKDLAMAREPRNWEEVDAVTDKIANLEASIRSRDVWDDEVRETAGTIVSIGHNGELKVSEGWWRPKEVPQDAKKSRTRGASATHHEKTKSKPKPKGPYGLGDKPMTDLRNHRTDVIRAHLTPDLAQELLNYSIARSAFSIFSRKTLDLDPNRKIPGEAERKDIHFEPLLERYKDLNLDWLEGDDPWGGWLNLSKAARAELLAVAVAIQIKPQLSSDRDRKPELEYLVKKMEIDWTAVRPTVDLVFHSIDEAESARIRQEVSWARRERRKLRRFRRAIWLNWSRMSSRNQSGSRW